MCLSSALYSYLRQVNEERKMRQTAYIVHLFRLLGEPGWASTLAGEKRAWPENFRQKTGRPKKQRAGLGRAVIFRPMQGSTAR